MKGREFIEKINELEDCIVMFNTSLSLKDGSKLALTDSQQKKIRSYLNDYRKLLLENDVVWQRRMSMTEEGAKQILSDYRVVTGGFIDLREAIDIAIQSLEEIQQYRAIGTVEGYELAINESIDIHNLMIVYKDRLKEYESIGTIEEFKALKEGSRFLEFLYNHIPPNEMEQYLSMYQAKDKVVR